MTTTTEAPTLRSFDRLFIGGQWRQPSTDHVIEVISPVTEQVIATVPDAQPADIDAAVAAAREAFDHGPWPRMSPADRAAALNRVKDEVTARLPEMEASFTAEIGGPLAVSEAFHAFAVTNWASAASNAASYPFEEQRAWDGGRGTVVKEPVGVVAAIIPWNGPITTASLKLSQALAAGCTVVLKPAPEGSVGPLLLAEAIEAAGLPDGVVSIVPGGREAGEHLVTHAGVDKITFTGSTAAGQRIMSLCGDRIARVTLELGGKSAAIIADDIALDDFLVDVAFAGIGNTGQVCAALTRVLVPRHREQEVVDGLAGFFSAVKVGDPRDPETAIGPLVAERQRDRVEEYIRIGVEEGARVAAGGRRPADQPTGWFIEPTLFAGVRNDMRIAQEEIFGPVVCVIPFDSIDEAVEIANDSQYGLSGAVYASDRDLARQIASRVRTGQIAINSWSMCVTEPFGGYKQSGLGREGGAEGLGAFLETKLVIEG